LLEKGIIPFITLYHWDLPQALEDKGGWRVKDTSYRFADYTKEVVKTFSDRVVNWMTLNEPNAVVLCGYRDGEHAPGSKETPKMINQIIHNVLFAHGLGVKTIKTYSKKQPEVGFAYSSMVKIPKSNKKEDILAAKLAWYNIDDHLGGDAWWLEPIFKGKYPENMWKEKGNNVPEITGEDMKIISTPMDFLGLNIYTGHIFEAFNGPKGYREIPYPDNHPKSDMNWQYINSDCMYYGLKLFSEEYKPKKIYITENGYASKDKVGEDGKVHDIERINYLNDHFISTHKAISEGVNLAGYFLWTFMDNFEWSHGTSKQLGIVFTDYKTQKRIIKDSGFWYREIIKQNSII